jgi:2-keto-4-pentenoate hydratase/2-oxohepta-3-ene-1,7-dioic acid hydratase in catechol pathway
MIGKYRVMLPILRSKVRCLTTNIYNYRHTYSPKLPSTDLPELPRSILAVAKNYLGPNESRTSSSRPLLFSKSVNSLIPFSEPILLNGRSDCHFELELALLIGAELVVRPPNSTHSISELRSAVAGLGLALDLTLKQPQTEMRKIGGPWEISKAFDRSLPLSPFHVLCTESESLWFEQDRLLTLRINGEIRQQQKTHEMIHDPIALLSEITKYFSLLPGDVVLTGTPVKPRENEPLKSGDFLEAEIQGVGRYTTRVLS